MSDDPRDPCFRTAKVSPMHEQVAQPSDNGTVSAFTYVSLPCLGGRERTRKISMGVMHWVSMETAKDMVHELRASAGDHQVHAEVRFTL